MGKTALLIILYDRCLLAESMAFLNSKLSWMRIESEIEKHVIG